MKYFLILVLLLASSASMSKDKTENLKSVKEMLQDIEAGLIFQYNNRLGFYLGDRSPSNALLEISKNLENDSDYIVIKKGSFRLIRDKKNGHVYFGNQSIIVEAVNDWTYQSVHLLIDKPIKGKGNALVPDDFGCRDFNVLDWIERNDFEEYNYLPLIRLNDEDFNKKVHTLYTIPYFNSNSNAVVIALGESGNRAGSHSYIVFDTKMYEYAILGWQSCGVLPPSIINRTKQKNILFKIKKMFNLVN